MTFNETMDWQYTQAHNIKRLAKLGDPLACRLVAAYRALYAKQTDPYLQSEWMKVCDDYCRRDLMLATRKILLDRFGHKEPKSLKRMDS
jgi:hypothetical protein